ncbi:MAG: hypothetical protein IR164_06900 [Devosia sp.]|jgi:hypothetical protein|nr:MULTISPECIES: hypothetical protein [unclassified Devosia]MBF0678649.1 hypothetical protein [Devosia sp.]WEJ31780.1 hypothetical protein NYQ88_12790 [Devosia sp. SD17-2]
MKHITDLPLAAGLPDAPMFMPKQRLESRGLLMRAIRAAFWPFSER